MNQVTWKKQGAALVGEIRVDGDTPARVVLVGPRAAPKGAVLVTSLAENGQLRTEAFYECISRVDPADLLQVICVQERQFGESALPPFTLQ